MPGINNLKMKRTLFMIASKMFSFKNIGVNVIKEVNDLYIANYKIVLKCVYK